MAPVLTKCGPSSNRWYCCQLSWNLGVGLGQVIWKSNSVSLPSRWAFFSCAASYCESIWTSRLAPLNFENVHTLEFFFNLMKTRNKTQKPAQCRCMPPGPGLAPAPSTANVSEDPFLGYLWQLVILTFFFFFLTKNTRKIASFIFK